MQLQHQVNDKKNKGKAGNKISKKQTFTKSSTAREEVTLSEKDTVKAACDSALDTALDNVLTCQV